MFTAPVYTVMTLTEKGDISRRKASVMAVLAALEPAYMPSRALSRLAAILNVVSLTHPWRIHACGYRADVDESPFGGNDEV